MSKVHFKDPLQFLIVLGLNPTVDNNFSKIRVFISCFGYFSLVTLSSLEVLLNFNGMETCARASESMIVLYQVVLKVTTLITYRKQLAVLIEHTQKFWSFDNFNGFCKAKAERVHKILKYVFRVYQALLLLMLIQFISRKLVYKNDLPLTITYGERNGFSPTTDFLVFIFHSLLSTATFYVISGFDGLFFYFVGHILTEIWMIKHVLKREQCKEDDFLTALKHHQFVLRFIETMNNIYSNLFLHQHVTCLFGICFGLFLLSEDGFPPDFEHITKYVPYVISFVTQTFIFCFFGSLIINWTLEIADLVFYYGWTNGEAYKYKYEKLIAMKRAQKAGALTIGGFGKLDLESFGLVMKNSYSFFTFINTMQEK